MLNKLNVKDIYPLSPMQESMLFQSLVEPDSLAYFEQTSFTIKGDFNIDKFKESIGLLFEKYDILRSIFIHKNVSRPFQVVLKKNTQNVNFIDISDFKLENQKEYLEQLKVKDRLNPFNLSNDVLMRTQVVKIAESTFEITWSHHHILMDGWCMSIIIKDFLDCYECLIKNEVYQFTTPIPYSTYIKWIETQDQDETLKLWKEYLAKAEQPTSVNTYGTKSDTFKKAQLEFDIDANKIAKIDEVCKDFGITKNTFFQSFWGVLLSKYNYSDKAIFGTVVSGRPTEIMGVETILGLFINTIPCIVDSSFKYVKDILIHNQNTNAELLGKDFIPLSEVQSQSDLGNNLFDHILVYENYPSSIEPENIDSSKYGFSIENVSTFEQTNYDLTVIFLPKGNNFKIKLDFNSEVYDPAFLAKYLKHYIEVIDQFLLNNLIETSQLKLEKEEDDYLVLRPEYINETIVSKFIKTSIQRPNEIAIYDLNESYTYKDLNERSNQLANYLKESKNIKSGDSIVLHLDRSVDSIICILAIIKLNATYIPIDKSNPIDRLNYIIHDSNSKLLISDEPNAYPIDSIDITELDFSQFSTENIDESSLDSRVYIIYTSGSTGTPKGCQITHKNLANYISWASDYYLSEKNINGNTALYSSLSFDLTVTSIFLPLTQGKSISIYGNQLSIEETLTQIFSNSKIDLVKITPAHISLLAHLPITETHVKVLIVGGEELKRQHLISIKKLNENIIIHNEYGPTETTIGCAIKTIRNSTEEINIGRAISNTKILIGDKDGNELPAGLQGEILIEGDGVGLGYFNLDELTADKFKFQADKRRYHSGDLGIQLSNGEFQFLGRIDDQVKIRGYRIELGEIESVLINQDGVENAFVTDYEKDFLIAFVVAKQNQNNEEDRLRRLLQQKLPDYMVPERFVYLNEIPLTSNGKVDKKSLLRNLSFESSESYKAPETETESQLVEIWKQVLKKDRIGINDNFFQLGGHSLKTTILSSLILKTFKKELKVKTLFETPVLSEQAFLIDKNDTSEIEELNVALKQEYYPSTSAQKRLYILQQLDESGIAYNIPSVLHFKGDFNVKKFKESFEKLTQEHEILRTTFHLKDGQPIQQVKEQITLDFSESIQKISEDSIAKLSIPFNLSEGPLFRCRVFKQEEKDFIVFIDFHHIIMDGVSVEIIIKKLTELYVDNFSSSFELNYKDFSVWQHHFADSDAFKLQKKYWLNQFKSIPEPLNLPYRGIRPDEQSFKGKTVSFSVSNSLENKLIEFNSTHSTSNFITLFAVFNILLNKYTAQKEFIIGTPVSGRTRPEIQEMLGVFINTLPLRINIIDDFTFLQFVSEIKELVLNSLDNQDYPFEQLVEVLNLEKDLSRNPLFDVMFILQNSNNEFPKINGLDILPYKYENKSAKVDLTLEVVEYEKGFSFNIEYNTDLFEDNFIHQLFIHYQFLLEQVLAEPTSKIKLLDVSTQLEKKEIFSFNNTKHKFEDAKTLSELFEEQVVLTPNAVALVFEHKSMTYQELNTKANCLAHQLRLEGIKSNDLVGLVINRSFEMVISIFATLKAGGAYMPLDPDIPSERLNYILKDSNCRVLLTDADIILEGKTKVFNFNENNFFVEEKPNLNLINSNTDLAYVIYTSGSTGEPKGVMLGHKGVVNRIEWMKNHYEFSSQNTVLQKTTYTFDVSVWEFFMTLCYGAKLVLCKKEDIADVPRLVELINTHEITDIHFVPSMHKMFLLGLSENDKKKLASLRNVYTSGEALSIEAVKMHYDLVPCKLQNLYGPTEASVDVSYFETSKNDSLVPIGKPIWNTELYILNENLNVLPIGVPGELYIGGVGVAKGYLNKEELTAEKFIQNPFNPESKLYKTGDLVKWMPDGNISFLGRIDFQVKIRGFRIELGDIESQLLKINGFNQVAVVDRIDATNDKYLCAYIVSEDEINTDIVKEFLSKELPEYMIPSFFMRLEFLPLTSSGKLNRKGLPDPKNNKKTTKKEEPKTDLEIELAKIWSNVLGIDNVFLNDNFFDLGGHSLKATFLASNIEKYFNISFSIKDVFKNPIFSSQITLLLTSSKENFQSLKKNPKRNFYPLSSAQKRMFVLDQFEDSSTVYNMPGIFHLKGALDKTKLIAVFNQLVERHSVLRSNFIIKDDESIQFFKDKLELKLQEFKADATTILEVCNEFIKPFDLSIDALIRVGCIEIEKEHNVLIYDMHHIISDGVSMDILVQEFIQLYNEKQLSNLEFEYVDYVVWQNETSKGSLWNQQEEFWKEQFKGDIPILDLPTDYIRPRIQKFEGAAIEFNLKPIIEERLRKLSKESNSTIFTIVLAAYNVFLNKVTKQNDIIVGIPVSGRSLADLEGMIGMFVNTLALRNYPTPDASFSSFLEEVKERSLDAFENQNYPFEELIEKLNLNRDMSRNPLFDTMLSYQKKDLKVDFIGELEITPFERERVVSKFDLSLDVIETNNELSFMFEYNTHLFSQSKVEKFVIGFQKVIEEIVEKVDRKIGDIIIISDSEKESILTNAYSNIVERDYKTFGDLLIESIIKNPTSIALRDFENEISFKEVGYYINTYQNQLKRNGIIKGDVVGVMCHSSIEMVCAIYATLTYGAIYLPLDSDYPQQRLEYMMKDAEVKAVFTNLDDIKNYSPTINIIDIRTVKVKYDENSILENNSFPTDSAYIIYTSGTTGTPKGVVIRHSSLYDYILMFNDEFKVEAKDCIIQQTSISFDTSLEELFCTVVKGGSVFIVNHRKELNKILEAIETGYPTILSTSPLVLNYINSTCSNFSSLSKILSGGDVLKAEYFNSIPKHIEIWNGYGPTESTVYVTFSKVDVSEENPIITIGKALPNRHVLILDESLNLMPHGISGELCVGGIGLAQEYLNAPEITASKFIDNPFRKGELLYKTGDLVCYKPDGNIEFKGRIDQQLKIRGFRIETKEVENALLAHDEINEVVVIGQPDNNGTNFLCAYYISDRTFSKLELQEFLRGVLPEYMIPSFFVELTEIPLTSNGKTDKKALINPIKTDVFTHYIEPNTLKEKSLAIIWESVLNTNHVGLEHNFFDLGGDSIKAIQVASRFKNAGYSISVKDIFENPVLQSLALKAQKSTLEIDQSEVFGLAPFTPIIDSFINHSKGNINHFNQSLVLETNHKIEKEHLQKIFQKIVNHHDALRVQIENGQLLNSSIKDIEIAHFEVSEMNFEQFIREECDKIQQSFSIDKGSLFKVALFTNISKSYIAIIVHHLVIDGVSWRIILEDLQTLFTNLDSRLPLKTTSFIDWSLALNSYAQQRNTIAQKDYWNSILTSEKLFEINYQKSEPIHLSILIEKDLTKKLNLDSNKIYGTNTGELLIAGLNNAIFEFSNVENYTLMLEGHGREEIIKNVDISRTVGWFTTEFPVSFENCYDRVEDLIISTKENLRSVPDKGMSYGLLNNLNKQVELTGNKPQVLFNYLGDFTNELQDVELSISKLSAGSNQPLNSSSEYVIEVNAYLLSGKLKIDIDFDCQYFDLSKAQEIKEIYLHSISMIISHCENKSKIQTASDFGLKNISHKRFDQLLSDFNYNVDKIYGLSPMQLGMLFVNLSDETDRYFEQTVLSLKGQVDISKFEYSFNKLIERHEVLRSNIIYDSLDEPLSIISKEKYSRVHFENLSNFSVKEIDIRINDFLNEEKLKGFNLAKDMLMLISVFQISENEYKIVWTHHHILMDGWCLGILLNDFFTIYNGEEGKLKEIMAYSDYLRWIECQDKFEAEDYWSDLLKNYDTNIEIPLKKVKTNSFENVNFEKSSFVLSEEQQEQIKNFSKANDVTYFNILQTVWGIVLQKLNSVNEVVFGAVIAGRPAELEGVEEVVGLFINTIPVKVSREENFKKTVKNVQMQFNQSNTFGYLPLNEISKFSSLGSELINHILIYENYPLDEKTKELNEKKSTFKLEGLETDEVTNFDFTITILPTTNLTITFDYNSAVFEAESIDKIRDCFVNVFDEVLNTPEREIEEIELLTKEEQLRILKLNPEATEREYSSFKDLFELISDEQLESNALIYNDQVLSYKELNLRSNSIANALITFGIGAGDVVGIKSAPCFEMIEGILGIIKTGAAYLPIDMNYPNERIEFMLSDSNVNYLLVSENESIDSIEILNLTNSDWKSSDLANPKSKIHPEDTAYIIYTSGSTGQPKGVEISQESFIDYVEFVINQFNITKEDTTLQHASIAFDTTIEELFPILGVGGKIYLPNDSKDFVEMLNTIASGQITYFCTSPLVLNYINEENKGLGNLRCITVGGDELKSSYVNNLVNKIEVWNGYGPTESTVCATYYKVTGEEDLMPIGKPFENREAFVMNQDGNILPYGFPGELCIGGKGIAKGYLNQKELTEEKFIVNPYTKSLMYRSGDLVKWNNNGDLNFYGRIDNQIQIRGFRVELGEIEKEISKIDSIDDVVILALTDKNTQAKYLCAYIIGEIEEDMLRKHILNTLPEYMVPTKYIFLEEFPLTTNGKIDKKALPNPSTNETEFILEAENERQAHLLTIWQEVLKNKNIGIESNFYSVGGDSIKAIQIASRIQRFDLKLDIRDLFTYPTIRLLEPHLKQLKVVAEQGLIQGDFSLTPIQQSFFDERLAFENHYNQAVMLFSKYKLELKKVQTVMDKLIAHHDALRTKFYNSEDGIKQKIEANESSIKVLEFYLEESEIEEKAEELQASLDIYKGKLANIALFHSENEGTHVFFAIHHLVVDGISWRIILEDLNTLMSSEELPLKTQSFKKWSVELKAIVETNQIKKELAYWESVLEGNKNLWTSEFTTYGAAKEKSFKLTKELTHTLLFEVNKAYNTEINDVLLSAIGNSLETITKQNENLIFLEGHGREELFEDQDVSRTVGWFTSMFPVKLKGINETSDLIKETKEHLRKIPNKGIGYGLLRYLSNDKSIQNKLEKIPEITFNYLGQFDSGDVNEGLTISTLSPGYAVDQRNKKESVLDISGMITDGVLSINLSYNPKLIIEQDVNEFIEIVESKLLEIINHCKNKEQSVNTASDFESKDLSNDELEDILDMLDDL